MKYCTKCGEKNPNEAKFCSKCGYPFAMEDSMISKETKEIGEYPKYATIIFGVLIAIYVFMAIGFTIVCPEAYSDYKAAARNWNERVYSYEMVYDAMLTYTIGVFISGILLGCLWYNKKRVTFYIYIAATIIANIIAIIFALNGIFTTVAAGSLYPFGVLTATIICLFIKVKGRSVYELLQ